jgi:16S rRNA (cytidine1402-2'-O)-methyltransferase
MVLLLHGAPPPAAEAIPPEAERILRLLITDLPLKQAVALAVAITGIKRNRLYPLALEIAAANSDQNP